MSPDNFRDSEKRGAGEGERGMTEQGYRKRERNGECEINRERGGGQNDITKRKPEGACYILWEKKKIGKKPNDGRRRRRRHGTIGTNEENSCKRATHT